MSDALIAFEEIWDVVCFCGVELRSGRTFKKWRDELGPVPPFRIDNQVLIVVFAGTAEIGSMLARGWALPARLLDLSPEYRNFVNGRARPYDRRGLLDALRCCGLPELVAELGSLRGGPSPVRNGTLARRVSLVQQPQYREALGPPLAH
jgi:hypothetical protein